MPQKNKVYIGLITIVALVIASVFVFYWARNQFSVSASTLPLVAEPAKLEMVVGQKDVLNISGGHLPYGGYLTTDPGVVTVDSWYNQSVMTADASSPFVLNISAHAPGQATIKVWDGVGAMAEVQVSVEPSSTGASPSASAPEQLPLMSTTAQASFTPKSVKLKAGEEAEVTVSLSGLSAQFSGIINSDSAVVSTVWFGATEEEGAINLTLKLKAVGSGIAQLALIHKSGEQLVLPVAVE